MISLDFMRKFHVIATIIDEVLMKLVQPSFNKFSNGPDNPFNNVTLPLIVSSRISLKRIDDIDRINAKIACQSDYY